MTQFGEQVRKAVKPKRKGLRARVKGKALFECGSCGRKYSSPLGHSCTGGGDFTRRKAAAGRREKAAAKRKRETDARRERRSREDTARHARREREDAARKARRAREHATAAAATATRSTPRHGRSGPPRHDYANCRDHDCERVPCEAWREGYDAGFGDGQGVGYALGMAAAQQNCSCG